MVDDTQAAEPVGRTNVRIHIDRQPYDSPSPTTGRDLYQLGRIPENRDLFREVSGEKEDIVIERGPEEIELRQDEHFYSQRDFNIIVNARKRVVASHTLSFQNVVSLAYDTPPTGPNILFTVVYRNGPDRNPEGTMIEGQHVLIKDGMIFNVTTTDKS